MVFAGAVTLALAGPARADHEGTPAGVSLVPEKTEVTIPDTIKLTATADRHLYGTGYSIVVIDDDSGAQIGDSCSSVQTWCVKYGTTSWASNADPQPRRFHAELRSTSGGGGGVSSGQVTVAVRKHSWELLSVVPTPQSQVVPGSVQFMATLDHPLAGGYRTYMYDEDNPLMPSSCGSNGWCAKTISRNWADNASPKPARVRVEVRNASGDLASNTIEATAPFRRFLFSVNLAFSTETDPSGNTIHKATATADRSVYATGYTLKIRKADGAEVCSASSSTQCGPRTATVGQTYRAVVEDSQGRNFGDSGAFTLTADGPRQETIDGVDLAHLAGQFASSSAICNALAEYPGTHLMEPPSTLSDQYRICVTAATTSNRIDTLRAIAEAVGGAVSLGALWYLRSETLRPTPPVGTPPAGEDAEAPRPVPPPWLPQVQDLARTFVMNNPQLSQRAADEAASQCLFLVGKAGLSGAEKCSTLPIFATGVTDVPEATQHDKEALSTPDGRRWVLLNRESTIGKSYPGWATGRCDPPANSDQDCDEFPFFSTFQGGPSAMPTPSLKAISLSQNRSQGNKLQRFYGTNGCNVPVGNPFLVIPLPSAANLPTLEICSP